MTSLRYPVAGLILVFLLAFGIFLVALMPAAVMTPLLPTPATDNASLQPPKLYGLWWNGQGQAQWEGQQLDITWRLDWRGLTPGLELGFESGQVNATGWAGADFRALASQYPDRLAQ
jgi:general secretion pathway protein N